MDSDSGKRRHRPQHALKGRRSRLLGVLLVLLLALAAASAFYAGVGLAGFERMRRGENLPDSHGSGGAVNVLLIGTDARSATTASSDVVMVMHVPANNEAIYLVSIPRRTRLAVPGSTELRSPSAFAGAVTTGAIVKEALGAQADYAVTVDTAGFLKLAEVAGGIEVDNKVPVSLADRGISWPAGRILLSGKEAYIYTTFADRAAVGADDARTVRQQAVVRALGSRLRSVGLWLNPASFWRVIDAIASSVAVDQQLSASDALQLGSRTWAASRAGVRSTLIPTTTDNSVDEARAKALGKALSDDTMNVYFQQHPSEFG